MYIQRPAAVFRTGRGGRAWKLVQGMLMLVPLNIRLEIPADGVTANTYFIYITCLQFTKDFHLDYLLLPSEQFVKQNICHISQVRNCCSGITFHDCLPFRVTLYDYLSLNHYTVSSMRVCRDRAHSCLPWCPSYLAKSPARCLTSVDIH